MLINLISQFSAASCNSTFFGLKTWWYYLKADGNCNIGTGFNFLNTNGQSDLALIALAIVDDLLRVAVLIAIVYVIYGGILYTTSEGSPEQTGKAQDTIKNALAGLTIAILATAVVGFIGFKVG